MPLKLCRVYVIKKLLPDKPSQVLSFSYESVTQIVQRLSAKIIFALPLGTNVTEQHVLVYVCVWAYISVCVRMLCCVYVMLYAHIR
jgi:hypothetical protein